jgi:hypothetical protein
MALCPMANLRLDGDVSFGRRSSVLPYVGLGSGFGGWFGVALALIWDVTLPLGLVIGTAVGVAVGLLIDAIGSRRERGKRRRASSPQQ